MRTRSNSDSASTHLQTNSTLMVKRDPRAQRSVANLSNISPLSLTECKSFSDDIRRVEAYLKDFEGLNINQSLSSMPEIVPGDLASGEPTLAIELIDKLAEKAYIVVDGLTTSDEDRASIRERVQLRFDEVYSAFEGDAAGQAGITENRQSRVHAALMRLSIPFVIDYDATPLCMTADTELIQARQTAFRRAVSEGDTQRADQQLSRTVVWPTYSDGVDPTDLESVAGDTISLFVASRNGRINEQDANGDTLMHHVARQGDSHTNSTSKLHATFVVSAGDRNLRIENNAGLKPFEQACLRAIDSAAGANDALHKFLESSSNEGIVKWTPRGCFDGKTLLQVVVSGARRREDSEAVLAYASAEDINTFSKTGETALFYMLDSVKPDSVIHDLSDDRLTVMRLLIWKGAKDVSAEPGAKPSVPLDRIIETISRSIKENPNSPNSEKLHELLAETILLRLQLHGFLPVLESELIK